MDNYYSILGLSPDTATQADIKANFRKLAFKWHPDRNSGSDEATKMFRMISEAYSTLSDPELKSEYDAKHANEFTSILSSPGFTFAGNVIDEDDDIPIAIWITLEDALRGHKGYEVQLHKQCVCPKCKGTGSLKEDGVKVCPKCQGVGKVVTKARPGVISQVTCESCGGTGKVVLDPCPVCGAMGKVLVDTTEKVDIPAGVDNGSILRVVGGGNQSSLDKPSGDLYVTIRLLKHSVYHRQGQNLYMKLKVPPETIMLGGEVEVQLPLGGSHKQIIPPCSRNQYSFVIPGHGVPKIGMPNRRGMLVVALEAEFPTNLTNDEVEALKQYAEKRKESAKQPDSNEEREQQR